MNVAGLTALRFIDFGTVLYGQNDQYYQIGQLREEKSTIVLFVSSHATESCFGIISICKNYRGGYFKTIYGISLIEIYASSDGTLFAKVPLGELVSITALGNRLKLISVVYGVVLPSDAILL